MFFIGGPVLKLFQNPSDMAPLRCPVACSFVCLIWADVLPFFVGRLHKHQPAALQNAVRKDIKNIGHRKIAENGCCSKMAMEHPPVLDDFAMVILDPLVHLLAKSQVSTPKSEGNACNVL